MTPATSPIATSTITISSVTAPSALMTALLILLLLANQVENLIWHAQILDLRITSGARSSST